MKNSNGSILVIDDDNFICEILSRHLQNNNYQTQTAISQRSAMELLKKNDFDLVLCDYRLPDGSGLEILQSLRSMQLTMPVIIMTAYADVRMAVKLIKMGAADYITKPIKPKLLVSKVKALLRRLKEEHQIASDTLHVAGIEINREEYKIIKDDVEIDSISIIYPYSFLYENEIKELRWEQISLKSDFVSAYIIA